MQEEPVPVSKKRKLYWNDIDDSDLLVEKPKHKKMALFGRLYQYVFSAKPNQD